MLRDHKHRFYELAKRTEAESLHQTTFEIGKCSNRKNEQGARSCHVILPQHYRSQTRTPVFIYKYNFMEVERVRYEKLRQVLKKAVEQTIKKLLMPEQLEKCFPRIAQTKGGPEALEWGRVQVQDYFFETCSAQFDHIFNERDIEQKLNELDEIIQTAQQRKKEGGIAVEVDKLTASQIIGASIGGSKEDCIKKLEMVHEQLMLDNQYLYKELKDLSEESETIKGDILLQVEALASGIDDFKRQEFDARLDRLTEEVFQ